MLTVFKKLIDTNSKKRLLKNYIALSILQGANFIIPLLVLPYLVRVLGAKTFGLVMFAQAFIMYFNVLVDYGFSLSGVREVAVHREDTRKLREIFFSIITIKILLIILSFFIMLAIIESFERFNTHVMLYIFSFGWVVGQALFPVWFFQGIEQMKYITILKISAQIISLAAIVVFVHAPEDYLLVPVFNSVGFILVGLISIAMIVHKFGFEFYVPSLTTLKRYFFDSSQFFLSRAAVSVYTSSNAFVLGIFTNNTLVGYYSIAEKLYIALQALYMPIVNVLYPFVAKERNIVLYKKIFKFLVIFNIVLIGVLFFMSPFLVHLISGTYIQESVAVFRIFLIVALIVVPSILIGYPFLAALGYARYANLSVVFAAIFHTCGLSVLTLFNHVTIYSIVKLLIITQLVDFSIRFYGVRKHRLLRTE